jgi:hypothetical protein
MKEKNLFKRAIFIADVTREFLSGKNYKFKIAIFIAPKNILEFDDERREEDLANS